MHTKIVYLILYFIFSSFCADSTENLNRSFKIGIVTDGSHDSFKQEIDLVKEEITGLLGDEFKVNFLVSKAYQGHWTSESVEKAIAAALYDPDVDIVITLGVLSSQLTKKFIPLSKPVFATFVINEKMQNFPYESGTSGVDNFNYLTLSSNVLYEYKIFRDMVPHDHAAFLIEGYLLQTLPDIQDQLSKLTDETGVMFRIVPTGHTASEVLGLIPESSEAVYVAGISGMSDKEKKKLFEGLIQLDLPSYSYYGKNDVALGALATMTPDIEPSRFARRLALNVQRYLLGENLSALPVVIEESHYLMLNQETLWGLNLTLPWKYIQDAEILGASEERPYQQIDITEAVLEGLEQNVNLAAAKQEVYIGYQELKRAYSYLFPQIDLSSLGRVIDLPTAYVSAGFTPQREISGKASLSQIIYSNERFGQVTVEKWLQAARCDKYRTERLDLAFEISTFFLNTLRVASIEDIQRNNLRITRTNLKIAEQRVRVGQARTSEVYRWESEIAKKRANLIVSHFDVLKNKIHLNRLLNRPVGGQLNLRDGKDTLNKFILTPDVFNRYITSDSQLETLMKFSVLEGLNNSPEIREIQDQIYAQSAVLGITKRAFYAPEVAFQSEFKNRWGESGAGTVGPAHTGGDDWVVGINVRFPLYTGGRKTANNLQALEKLRQLLYLKEGLMEIIDEKIRKFYFDAGSAVGVLRNAQLAAKAAANNMERVYDAYVKGKSSILDVLDAQNQLLISELDQTNAFYDYLIGIVGVQREMGRYDFLLPDVEKNQLKKCLQNLFEK